MSPLLESDLVFSSASYAIGKTLTELTRSNLSVKNRLHSIKSDSDFVLGVAKRYQLPLIANERCGSWYIPSNRKDGSAYFKSTDGHIGQWSFSLRRLNVQILEVLEKHGGCVIVDSTRRGKSMPDALSKTVPIWVAVMNRLLFPDRKQWHGLATPGDLVSESEHHQIETRLNGFVKNATDLGLDLEGFRQRLNHKPMSVIWQRPADDLAERTSHRIETNTIVLCTASNHTSTHTAATSEYVQGAADDSESWAMGLDAVTFWEHSDRLLACSEDELPEVIHSILIERRGQTARPPIVIKPTRDIWIGDNATAETLYLGFDVIISCDITVNANLKENMQDRYVHLQCTSGKNGSRQLRSELSKIQALRTILHPSKRVLMTCQTGRDLAVGLALAVLCLFCDGKGGLSPCTDSDGQAINKVMIKQRLSWIMVSMPDAAPSRATLQSVNAFLMG